MDIQNFTFHGPVRIYLQGLNALEAVDTNPDYQAYYLGSPLTKIKIRDYRRLPREASQRALAGNEVYQFAEVFNHPGFARIVSSDGNVEIDIHEEELIEESPILWMGVVCEGDFLSLVYVDWEILKPAGENRTGFAALVRDN